MFICLIASLLDLHCGVCWLGLSLLVGWLWIVIDLPVCVDLIVVFTLVVGLP